jgi:hypothetical protein
VRSLDAYPHCGRDEGRRNVRKRLFECVVIECLDAGERQIFCANEIDFCENVRPFAHQSKENLLIYDKARFGERCSESRIFPPIIS